ncbi:hypothetical protein [Kineococcus sp. SYSU DK001]|uniref:hypothetical protein n=1 Tax=Kineococcus sp. SYSU DK001 TaxID=3383122 RepID=UPI003D7EFADB
MADPASAPDGERQSREPSVARAVRRAALLAERAMARQRRSRRGVTVRRLPVERLPLLRHGGAPASTASTASTASSRSVQETPGSQQ